MGNRDCDQELCPMWDGHTCPCETFGFDRVDVPAGGTYTRTIAIKEEEFEGQNIFIYGVGAKRPKDE